MYEQAGIDYDLQEHNFVFSKLPELLTLKSSPYFPVSLFFVSVFYVKHMFSSITSEYMFYSV